MINLTELWKSIVRMFRSRYHVGCDSEWYHGALIYHTKNNPHRKRLVGLSSDGIANMKRHLKARWPIRFFLQEELPRSIKQHIFWPVKHRVRRAIWNFKYTFIRRHQYHLVRPRTLKKDYYDIDTRLLHSMFELLSSYKEVEYDSIHWDSDEEHRKIGDEINNLYKWWTEVRPLRDARKNELYEMAHAAFDHIMDKEDQDSLLGPLRAKYKHAPEYAERAKYYDEINRLEQEWQDEDTEMMIRLVKIRQYLWS